MSRSDAQTVRVTITLKLEIYDKIKEISNQLGLHPSTWIGMVATSKANNIDMKIEKKVIDTQ
ncbi:MAG: hypothetical protein HXS53_09495 [Theionarchaea archaeon]|nr:hypothetical protein [Theionarchaea archaeon]